MFEQTSIHTAVSIGKKMFMVGGNTMSSLEVLDNFKVFDSFTRMFTTIKSLSMWITHLVRNTVVCVGYNIYCYDVKNNQFYNFVKYNKYCKFYLY